MSKNQFIQEKLKELSTYNNYNVSHNDSNNFYNFTANSNIPIHNES